MRLADAKKLKAGERIHFGTSTVTARNTRTYDGVVRFVSSRGGIRVDTFDAKTGEPLQWPEWVPYSWVIRKCDG